MKSNHLIIAVLAIVLIAGILVFDKQPANMFIEFSIQQDMNVILFSAYGEPAQFAIWLENPKTGQLKTIFVTHRSGTGDWQGKVECPAALPKWFEVFKQETGKTELPNLKFHAPDAVTGATPQTEHFTCITKVEPDSEWICWIEVNIAADFNTNFVEYNEQTGVIDTDRNGQPSILYRAQITADPNTQIKPELYAYAIDTGQKVKLEQNLDPITTARDIFKSIEIRIIKR